MKTPCELKPLHIHPIVWTNHSMDFVDMGLPKSGNKYVIMVMIDRLSKYSYFCAQQHPFKVSIVTQLFMVNTIKLHGIPQFIVVDHDITFNGNFWLELFSI
jgi:hypothetical protein